MNDTNWQPYWTAALKRHKALIAAGCISQVGARRVAPGKQDEDDAPPAGAGKGEANDANQG